MTTKTAAPVDALGTPMIPADQIPLQDLMRLPVRHANDDRFGDPVALVFRADMLTVTWHDTKRAFTRPRSWFWVIDEAARKKKQEDAARREALQDQVDSLDLWADNDEPTVHAFEDATRMVCKHIERGKYDPELHAKAYEAPYTMAAHEARKQGSERFTLAARREAARQRVPVEYAKIMHGEYLTTEEFAALPGDASAAQMAKATREAIERSHTRRQEMNIRTNHIQRILRQHPDWSYSAAAAHADEYTRGASLPAPS